MMGSGQRSFRGSFAKVIADSGSQLADWFLPEETAESAKLPAVVKSLPSKDPVIRGIH